MSESNESDGNVGCGCVVAFVVAMLCFTTWAVASRWIDRAYPHPAEAVKEK